MKMYQFIIRRLLLLIPVLLGVTIIVFALLQMTGDPAAAFINPKMSPAQQQQIRELHHFNDPPYVQYFYWLSGIIQGDWGFSTSVGQPVTTAIAEFFPATFELAVVAMIIAVVIGISLGTTSAIRRNKPFDHATRVISLFGVSIPIFVLGLILIYLFSYTFKIFPLGDRFSSSYIITGIPHVTGFLLIDSLYVGNFNLFLDAAWHLILPAITLAFTSIAIITRIMRNSMLEVLGLDYVKTARAKGLPEKVVTRKHARKNAMIPTTTIIGLAFGGLLGGAVLTESIFNWPGLGRYSVQAIAGQDIPAILGFVLLTAIIYVLVNLVVDVLYAYLDPRVRLE
jgi:ABC-type dipeptide/oligopeptide/nickel transport system permease component